MYSFTMSQTFWIRKLSFQGLFWVDCHRLIKLFVGRNWVEKKSSPVFEAVRFSDGKVGEYRFLCSWKLPRELESPFGDTRLKYKNCHHLALGTC